MEPQGTEKRRFVEGVGDSAGATLQPTPEEANLTTEPRTSLGGLELSFIAAGQELPPWTNRDELTAFLHESLKPYEDTVYDIRRGIDDALGNRPAAGGFVVLACADGRLAGALVLLRTGMAGYVPENLVLFVAVDRSRRRRGIGARLLRSAVQRCDGDVKLHVEYDNPAKRLYERLGFQTKYAEMRFIKGGHE